MEITLFRRGQWDIYLLKITVSCFKCLTWVWIFIWWKCIHGIHLPARSCSCARSRTVLPCNVTFHPTYRSLQLWGFIPSSVLELPKKASRNHQISAVWLACLPNPYPNMCGSCVMKLIFPAQGGGSPHRQYFLCNWGDVVEKGFCWFAFKAVKQI